MNKPAHKQLWENIQNFAFDDPASDFPFSKKLQKENNWTSAFTADAIEEYRKFMFLCCILPNGASPSEIVDRVWHLHLTYTTNYWIGFCRTTLHKEIHHFPSKGGTEEKTKHVNWYLQTLEQYAKVFGTSPPASFWPAGPQFVEQVSFDIYDKNFFQKTTLAFALFSILFVLMSNLFHTKGQDFLVYYFVLMTAGIITSAILQLHKAKKLEHFIDQYFPLQCSPYQAANFLYGRHRAYQVALVDLLKRDIIDTAGEAYKLTTAPGYDPQKEQNPLLPALIENIAVGDTFTYQQGWAMVDDGKLQNDSFEQLTGLSKKVDYQKLVVPGIVLAVGFARLFQGMANEKPVTFLVFEIGFFSLIALMIAAQYSYTYLVFKYSKQTWMNHNNNGYSDNILNNFSLLGVSAIAGYAEYGSLTRVFGSEAPERKNTSGWDSGGTSSCSSGGDGGGGGGCGGGCGGCGGGD
ncbi:MAG: TIGR04222 domain-containing membrane protein [Ferruginibacter sp.]